MDDVIAWMARGVVSLLLGTILAVGGAAGMMAHQATPESEEASSPESAPASLLMEAEQEQENATLIVQLHNADLAAVPGGCVLAEHESGTKTEICDGRDDGAPDGTVTFSLPAGNYQVVVSQPPQGYASDASIPLSLTAGLTTPATIQLVPGGRSVFVNSVDAEGAPVTNACVSIFTADTGGHPVDLVSASCDAPNGESPDGSIAFAGIMPGSYVSVQTTVPDGHVPAGATPFTVPASGAGPVVVTMVNAIADTSGDLKIAMVDEHGETLSGACVGIHEDTGGGVPGAMIVQQCDADNGASDGLLLFTELAPGSYVAVEHQAPDGYEIAADRMVSVTSDTQTVVTFSHVPGGSDVTVRMVDANSGAAIRGGCVVVVEDDGGDPRLATPLADRCDAADGNVDGVTVFAGLPEGSYAAWERVAPETYRAVDAYVPFSVDGMTDVTITVENVPMTLVEQLVEVLVQILDDLLNG